MSDKTLPGDSREQQKAKQVLVDAPDQKLGVHLESRRVPLKNGGWLELDGATENLSVVVEALALLKAAVERIWSGPLRSTRR